MPLASGPLVMGYSLEGARLPAELAPLLEQILEVFRRHHSDLSSVYVMGSVATGEWVPGISDIDVEGLSRTAIDPADDAARRRELVELGRKWKQISFIDDNVFNLTPGEESDDMDILTRGYLTKLAVTGVCVWGQNYDMSRYIPDIQTTAYERTERARAVMVKRRSGDVVQPFRENPRLLTRACAKTAMRVMSSMTILRGAPFYSSAYKTSALVDQYVPEASELNKLVIDALNRPEMPPTVTMAYVDTAIELFYKLFPLPEALSK